MTDSNNINNTIANMQEEIWEIKAYLNSDICQYCSYMYEKLSILENKLKELKDNASNNQ